MKVQLFLLLLVSQTAYGQTKAKSLKPDTIKIKSEIKELENVEQQLTDKIFHLKIACRQDSIGIVNLKTKKKNADYQTAILNTEITGLENMKNKTREQKKLLKNLKDGHTQIKQKFAGLDQELNDIETNHNNNLSLLLSAENLVKELTQKLRDLRK